MVNILDFSRINLYRYCIPSSHKEEFEHVIKEKYCELFIFHPDLLYNIVLTMNPLELVKRNVKNNKKT